MTYKAIMEAFVTEVDQLTIIDKVRINDHYMPELRQPYIRYDLELDQTEQISIGNSRMLEKNGDFIVNVVEPVGVESKDDTADIILQHFNSLNTFSNINVDYAWRATAVQDKDWYTIPIRISFYTVEE